MENVVVKVTLPKGFALKSRAYLPDDLSIEVISMLTPFYASVPQVRLEGGPYMSKLKDTTIAAAIYQASKEANQKNDAPPLPTSPEGKRFLAARNNWVINYAAYNMLVNLSGLVGYTGGYVLGNFSITKQRGEQHTGVRAKIDDLQDAIKSYQVVLESGGKVIPGGRAPFAMAAKGLMDGEATPGRTWSVSGMGANVKTMEIPSPTGGRGKTYRVFFAPILSFSYAATHGYTYAKHPPYSGNFMLGAPGTFPY